MASMKYIRDEHGRFIIFSNTFQHKDVAKALELNAVSAGNVAMFDDQIRVSGESVTLNLSSDSKDAERIKRQLDFYDGF